MQRKKNQFNDKTTPRVSADAGGRGGGGGNNSIINSEIVNTQKSVTKTKLGFYKISMSGGGGHHFIRLYPKILMFFW